MTEPYQAQSVQPIKVIGPGPSEGAAPVHKEGAAHPSHGTGKKYVVLHTVVGHRPQGDVVTEEDLGTAGPAITEAQAAKHLHRLISLGAIREATPEEAKLEHVEGVTAPGAVAPPPSIAGALAEQETLLREARKAHDAKEAELKAEKAEHEHTRKMLRDLAEAEAARKKGGGR